MEDTIEDSKEILRRVNDLDRKVLDFEKRFDEWVEKRRFL